MNKKTKMTVKPLEIPDKVKTPLGLVTRKKQRQFFTVRMRVNAIDELRAIRKKIEKATGTKCSQSMAIEAVIYYCQNVQPIELLKAYSQTFLP